MNNLFIPLEYTMFGGVEVYTEMEFYHASLEKIPEGTTLTPQEYYKNDTFFREAVCEDCIIPRFCLSTSIEGCLKAIYHKINKGDKVYIYKIVNCGHYRYNRPLNIIKPTMNAVWDSFITHEYWCLNPISPEYYELVGIATINEVYYLSKQIHKQAICHLYDKSEYNKKYGEAIDCFDPYSGKSKELITQKTCPEVFFNYEPVFNDWKAEPGDFISHKDNGEVIHFEKYTRMDRCNIFTFYVEKKSGRKTIEYYYKYELPDDYSEIEFEDQQLDKKNDNDEETS